MTTFSELNTACQWNDQNIPKGFIVIRDTAPADGSLFLHHLLNTHLIKQQKTPGKGVVFVSLNHTYVHYHTIELKLNTNLQKEGENGTFKFVDALQNLTSSFIGNTEDNDDTLFFSSPLVAQSIEKKRPSCLSVWKPSENSQSISDDLLSHVMRDGAPDCIIFDHLNPLLYANGENADSKLYKTLQHLHRISKQGTTVVVALHGCGSDESSVESRLANAAEHLSDVVFRVSGLPTGYSKDVHGQVEVIHRKDSTSYEPPKRVKLHYKTFEHQVKLFAPGFGLA
jgi:dethiobiotin synthetase